MLTGRGPYLGALLGLPPARSAEALGTFRDVRRARSLHPSDAWSVSLPHGRLLIVGGGDPIEAPAGTHAWPLRRLVGTLLGDRVRFRIELELSPWSDTRSELGIRPLGHWPPGMRSPLRYYVLAEEALMAIAREVTEWDGARAMVDVA